MIWDRFDDAHDDVIKDIRDIQRDVRVLEVRLKTAGIEYAPFKAPESGGEPGPQGWYDDTLNEERAYGRYRDYLRGLLAAPKPD